MPEIITQRNGPVTTLLISNPARMNAMSRDMWMQLAEGIRAADADPKLGAVLAPYPLWCSFATVMSAEIWRLNR